MYIIGKVQIQGEKKDLLIKQEDNLFKYYSLEILGAYLLQGKERNIVFKENIKLLDKTKSKIIELLDKNNIENSKNMKIIGNIILEGKTKELLLRNENGIFKFYYLNLIGVYTLKMPGNLIIFREDTLENKVSADIKDIQPKKQISETEKEQIQKFLEKIRILDIIERLQIEQKTLSERTNYNKTISKDNVKQKEIDLNKKEKETIEMKQQPKQEKNKLGDINIKQEVKMNTRVTDMKNLEQVLQKSGKLSKLENGDKPAKMGIVESDDLKKLKDEKGQKEKAHSSRYEAVVVTQKGNVQALDLENDTTEGTNPLEKNYQVKQDGSVKSGDVITRLKVGEGSIAVEKGKYGEVEVFHSPRKTIGGKNIEGNKNLDRQLETSNSKNPIEGTDIETLKLAQEYNDGYRSVEEGYQEMEAHKEKNKDCEEMKVEEIDGDPNTHSHTHNEEEFVQLSSGEKVTYNELATRWGFYKDGKPDADFVKEKFKQKEEDKKPEEVIEQLDEEYEDPRAPEGRT